MSNLDLDPFAISGQAMANAPPDPVSDLSAGTMPTPSPADADMPVVDTETVPRETVEAQLLHDEFGGGLTRARVQEINDSLGQLRLGSGSYKVDRIWAEDATAEELAEARKDMKSAPSRHYHAKENAPYMGRLAKDRTQFLGMAEAYDEVPAAEREGYAKTVEKAISYTKVVDKFEDEFVYSETMEALQNKRADVLVPELLRSQCGTNANVQATLLHWPEDRIALFRDRAEKALREEGDVVTKTAILARMKLKVHEALVSDAHVHKTLDKLHDAAAKKNVPEELTKAQAEEASVEATAKIARLRKQATEALANKKNGLDQFGLTPLRKRTIEEAVARFDAAIPLARKKEAAYAAALEYLDTHFPDRGAWLIHTSLIRKIIDGQAKPHPDPPPSDKEYDDAVSARDAAQAKSDLLLAERNKLAPDTKEYHDEHAEVKRLMEEYTKVRDSEPSVPRDEWTEQTHLDMMAWRQERDRAQASAKQANLAFRRKYMSFEARREDNGTPPSGYLRNDTNRVDTNPNPLGPHPRYLADMDPRAEWREGDGGPDPVDPEKDYGQPQPIAPAAKKAADPETYATDYRETLDRAMYYTKLGEAYKRRATQAEHDVRTFFSDQWKLTNREWQCSNSTVTFWNDRIEQLRPTRPRETMKSKKDAARELAAERRERAMGGADAAFADATEEGRDRLAFLTGLIVRKSDEQTQADKDARDAAQNKYKRMCYHVSSKDKKKEALELDERVRKHNEWSDERKEERNNAKTWHLDFRANMRKVIKKRKDAKAERDRHAALEAEAKRRRIEETKDTLKGFDEQSRNIIGACLPKSAFKQIACFKPKTKSKRKNAPEATMADPDTINHPMHVVGSPGKRAKS